MISLASLQKTYLEVICTEEQGQRIAKYGFVKDGRFVDGNWKISFVPGLKSEPQGSAVKLVLDPAKMGKDCDCGWRQVNAIRFPYLKVLPQLNNEEVVQDTDTTSISTSKEDGSLAAGLHSPSPPKSTECEVLPPPTNPKKRVLSSGKLGKEKKNKKTKSQNAAAIAALTQRVADLERQMQENKIIVDKVLAMADKVKQDVHAITMNQQKYLNDITKTNIEHLANADKMCAGIDVTTLDDETLSLVFPPMLTGDRKGPANWNVVQCTNMFKWDNKRPQCRGAHLYVQVEEDGDGVVKYKKYKKELHVGAKPCYLMGSNAKPLSYNLAVTRLFRNMSAKDANKMCGNFTICTACRGTKSNPDAYVPAGISKQTCLLCCTTTNITQTNAAQDKEVVICVECNTHCNRATDDLTFCLDKLKHLFPNDHLVVSKSAFKSYNTDDSKQYTPDTVIEFQAFEQTIKHYVLIEMDTSQHNSLSREKEVDRMERMGRHLLEANPSCKIFIIRFSPSGRFKHPKDDQQKGKHIKIAGLKTAQRLLVVRQWVIWYLATASERSHLPPFLLLYLWYDVGSGKVLEAQERFTTETIGQTYGIPSKGVWDYYSLFPYELEALRNSYARRFDETGCRDVAVDSVFYNYNNFNRLKTPRCFIAKR